MIVKGDPKELLLHQIKNMYLGYVDEEIVNSVYDDVLKKMEYCFSHIANKYYRIDNTVLFNSLHVAQWTVFLYNMAREISTLGDSELSDKIYGLSKMISSADIFYGVELPNIWFCDHPQGSVIGRAQYDDYFSFSQGCTVGNNKGSYPVIGKHVSMMSGSKILGKCNIGHHVIMSANSYIVDKDVPPYSIVFGSGRDAVIHPITQQKFLELTSAVFTDD